MPMLSEDDLNLRDMSAEQLDAAWDLWFDLAQTTNDSDPLYSHGVLVCSEPWPPPAASHRTMVVSEPSEHARGE